MYCNKFLFIVFGFVSLTSPTLPAIDLTCNVSVNSSLIGDPWVVCINVYESHVDVHRISIQHDGSGSRSRTELAVCSKLNSDLDWFTEPKSDTRINVSCPRKSETLQMCVNVAQGRKTDTGNLSVYITDETGTPVKLCSQYLFLEEEVFPRLKLVCTDMEKNMISIDMDLSNISQKDISNISQKDITKYMVSAWFGSTDFPCENSDQKKSISCDHKELKSCFAKFTCHVNKEAMLNMTRTFGSSDTVNITIEIKNLNRNTTTRQNVEAKISCEEGVQSRDNGLSWEAIKAAIICAGIFFIVLVYVVVHVVCVWKKRASSHENSLHLKVQNSSPSSESEEGDEEDGIELLSVIENRGGNDDNPHQDRDLYQDHSSNAVKDGKELSSMKESQKQENARKEAARKVFAPGNSLQDDESDQSVGDLDRNLVETR